MPQGMPDRAGGCNRDLTTLEGMAWWAVQQAAATAAARRLRTHLGGPTDTFAALERSLAAALSALNPTATASPGPQDRFTTQNVQAAAVVGATGEPTSSGFHHDMSQRGDMQGSTQVKLARRQDTQAGGQAPKLLVRAPPAAPAKQSTAAGGGSSKPKAAPAGKPELRAVLLRRLPLLLEFVAALEKLLHACFEGTLARSVPSGNSAAVFFTQNRKV